MGKFRLASIAQLARQLEFAPNNVRAVQLQRAEDLLHTIEPGKGYPLDFVVEKITDYRPRTGAEEILAGGALQHDLGLLIERVSATLNLTVQGCGEPVLSIGDLCERLSITSKTVQRWRRRGLAARWLTYPNGKQRVGFLLSTVERFLARHRDQPGNCGLITEAEQERIVRHARRLAPRCEISELTRRIGRLVGRSPLAVLHTLRKYDVEHAEHAILPATLPPIDQASRLAIVRAWRRGESLAELAARFGRPRSAIYHVLLEERVARLTRRRIRFHDDPLYHQEGAAEAIEAMLHQEELGGSDSEQEKHVPAGLPPCLAEICRTPLLSKARERALFLKLNFHKYQFVRARRRLDPELARNRELREMERHLALINQTKDAIVRANLRLVVSVARKHLRPGLSLNELISDGNMTLMRAVDGFDVHRGSCFSTYATLALMKGFARSVPAMLSAGRGVGGQDDLLSQLPDRAQSASIARILDREEVGQLLSRLDQRERDVLSSHWGLGQRVPETYEQVGHRLGLSKERVRQIEQRAMAKLRAGASQGKAGPARAV